MSEIEALRGRYRRREERGRGRLYDPLDPGSVFLRQGAEREIIVALRALFPKTSLLSELSVLEVGCGEGWLLGLLRRLGLRARRLWGVDLLPRRLAAAARLLPESRFLLADAADLPLASDAFDLAVQSTVFTSVLSKTHRRRMAAEMVRTLRPGGALLWYDMRYDNPWNRDIRGIGKAEFFEIFSGLPVELREIGAVTLAPPLARPIARRSTLLASLAEKLPPLRSHLLAVIEKDEG